METKIEIQNVKQIEERLGSLKKKTPTVLANAINRAVTSIKKSMAIETSSKYNITSTDVKKTISIHKATRSNLVGRTISRSSPIALAKFKVSPNSPLKFGVSGKRSPLAYKASVKKGKIPEKLDKNPKAFIAIMKSGHKGVFIRKTGESLPMKQLFGPSVPQMVKNEDSIRKIEKESQSTLEKRIDAEINNILRKGR